MRNCRYNKSIVVLITLISFFSVSCASKKEEASEKPVTGYESTIGALNRAMYCYSAIGYSSMTFDCSSKLFAEQVNEIKDDVLRNQLKNTKFIVTWDQGQGFRSAILNVPELPNKKDNQTLVNELQKVKSRILGAFVTSSILFDGVILSPGSETIKMPSASTGTGKTIKVNNPHNNIEQKLFIGSDDRLEKIESKIAGKLIATSIYSFSDNADSKLLLKSVKVLPAKSKMPVEISLKYVTSDHGYIPSEFMGALNIANRVYDDQITVKLDKFILDKVET